jgi:hypothetical protein
MESLVAAGRRAIRAVDASRGPGAFRSAPLDSASGSGSRPLRGTRTGSIVEAAVTAILFTKLHATPTRIDGETRSGEFTA